MRKIVIACGFRIDKEAIALLSEVAQVTVTRDDSEGALLSEAGDADAILVGPRPYVRKDLIEPGTELAVLWGGFSTEPQCKIRARVVKLPFIKHKRTMDLSAS